MSGDDASVTPAVMSAAKFSFINDSSYAPLLQSIGVHFEAESFVPVNVRNVRRSSVLVVFGADEFHQLRTGRQRARCELELHRAREGARIVQREIIRHRSVADACPS